MTVFLPGDRIDRRITARDANRMLRAAQEYDAGLGNISARQLIDTFENGHILVRNDTNLRTYPFCVMGFAQAESAFQFELSNVNRRLNIFIGQKPKVYKHWFRHCVLQQSAAPGEVVPAAVSGLTFASVDTPRDTPSILAVGAQVALVDGDMVNNQWPYSGFFEIGSTGVGRYGHAEMIRAGAHRAIIRTALINMKKITPCWRITLTNRVSSSEFDGSLDDYLNLTPGSGTLKVYDPQGICPGTSVVPTGSCTVKGFVEIYQRSIESNDKTFLPDIAGILISVNAATVRDGLQEETMPPP